jgi:hypothetical protein
MRRNTATAAAISFTGKLLIIMGSWKHELVEASQFSLLWKERQWERQAGAG